MQQIEQRAFLERAAIGNGRTRARRPTEHMRSLLSESILAETEEQLSIIARLQQLKSSGLWNSTESQWLRLNLAKSEMRLDSARGVERRAFPQSFRETR